MIPALMVGTPVLMVGLALLGRRSNRAHDAWMAQREAEIKKEASGG